MNKSDFLNSLKVNIDFDIQVLKVKLDNGEVKAIDLSDEQIEKLQLIYEKEIEEKMQKIERLEKECKK